MDASRSAAAAAEAEARGIRFRGVPHPALGPFVVEYWGLARDLGAMGGFTITPDCFGELIACADAWYAVDGETRTRLPSCVLVGLLDRPLRIEADGIVRCMAARLRPWAIGPVAGLAVEGQSPAWEDARSRFGSRLDHVVDLVGRCEWAALVDVFDAILKAEVEAGRWDRRGAGVAEASRLAGRGGLSPGLFPGSASVTPRQVERRVRRLTRTSPKQLACLARFQATRDAIWADPGIDLARLAAREGYSDQPHMTRQFRKYAGQTPARFALECLARKRWLNSRDVGFVQESGRDAE